MEVSMELKITPRVDVEYYSRLHRSMTRPFFTHDRISHFDIFERHADQTIALMNERFNVGLAIDFQVRFLQASSGFFHSKLHTTGYHFQIYPRLCLGISFRALCRLTLH